MADPELPDPELPDPELPHTNLDDKNLDDTNLDDTNLAESIKNLLISYIRQKKQVYNTLREEIKSEYQNYIDKQYNPMSEKYEAKIKYKEYEAKYDELTSYESPVVELYVKMEEVLGCYYLLDDLLINISRAGIALDSDTLKQLLTNMSPEKTNIYNMIKSFMNKSIEKEAVGKVFYNIIATEQPRVSSSDEKKAKIIASKKLAVKSDGTIDYTNKQFIEALKKARIQLQLTVVREGVTTEIYENETWSILNSLKTLEKSSDANYKKQSVKFDII